MQQQRYQVETSMRVEVTAAGPVIHFCCAGLYDAGVVIDTMVAEHARRRLPHALWDLRRVAMHSFVYDDFEAVAMAGARVSPLRGAGAKTALLVGSEIDRLLLRAFVSVNTLMNPTRLQIFMNRREALVWLTSIHP